MKKNKKRVKRKQVIARESILLPRPPERPVKARNTLREFYSFSIMKLIIAILMLAVVTLAILTPLFSRMTVIPCKVLGNTPLEEAFPDDAKCPVNPAAPAVSTLYFSNGMLDQIYSLAYLLVFFVFVPYTLGCAVVLLYKRYFGNNDS